MAERGSGPSNARTIDRCRLGRAVAKPSLLGKTSHLEPVRQPPPIAIRSWLRRRCGDAAREDTRVLAPIKARGRVCAALTGAPPSHVLPKLIASSSHSREPRSCYHASAADPPTELGPSTPRAGSHNVDLSAVR